MRVFRCIFYFLEDSRWPENIYFLSKSSCIVSGVEALFVGVLRSCLDVVCSGIKRATQIQEFLVKTEKKNSENHSIDGHKKRIWQGEQT